MDGRAYHHHKHFPLVLRKPTLGDTSKRRDRPESPELVYGDEPFAVFGEAPRQQGHGLITVLCGDPQGLG